MSLGKILTGPASRLRAALLAGCVLLAAAPPPSLAQQADSAKPAPAAPAPSPVEAPKTETPKAEAPKAEAPNAESPKAEAAPTDEAPLKATEIAARKVLQTRGAANWDEAYAKVNEAIGKLRAAAQKAGLKIDGRPLAAFTDIDDNGFKFEAMLPIELAPEAKPVLDADISLAESPSGKAIKFQHRGAYDDIDSTYEAITAYLDEKGIDARNLFVEDYLNEAKDSTDINLQVDIYVFLKDAPLAPTPAAPVPALPAATSSAPAAK